MKMNLVNHEYVKLSRFDIFLEIVEASEQNDDNKLEFFQEMYRTIMEYEKANRININEFHIRIDDIDNHEFFKSKEITIEREIILNAILFAAYNNDIEILKQLTQIPINKYELSQDELGENLDYILTHSIDINEYIDGEEEQIIYNVKENKIEKAYIFNSQKNKSYQRLKKK